MKLLKSIILCGVGVVALSLTSCNNWLDINTDPDSPSAEGAEYQQRLAHIQFYTSDANEFAGWRSNMACGDWTRYYNGSTYWNMSIWYPTSSICTTAYQWWFVGAYANVPDMISKADKAGNYAYKGAGELIKAYGMMLMTDLYGEMPYTEASAESSIPKYDTGKTIYLGCLNDIDNAIKDLEAAKTQDAALPSLAEGDSWNGGSLDKWIKLAYFLKARWCNKLNKKAAGSYLEGKYDKATILACLDKAMQSNADNTIINHTDENSTSHDVLGWDEPVDYSPLYSVCGMNGGYMPTKMLVNNLTNFNGVGVEDPRADKIIPWAYSGKSADSPEELKWNGNWRRSLGVDMASGINAAGGPLRASYGDAKSYYGTDHPHTGFYIASKNQDRWNDTCYVECTSSSKGYAANVDLLYRRGGGTGTDSRESGSFYTRVSSPTYVGTYAECCFIRAEVLLKDNQAGEAKTWYLKGVQAAMEQMNSKLTTWCNEDANLKECPSFTPMSESDITNYVNALSAQGNPTIGMILTQKRLALNFSVEIYNDMRRYDWDPSIFMGWSVPAYHALNANAMRAIPEGKQLRRWQQCSHELNYNADNLQAIGEQVPGATLKDEDGNVTAWNKATDVWTIPVWWDSDQE